MKLWKLSVRRGAPYGYALNCMCGIVVRAETEVSARNVATQSAKDRRSRCVEEYSDYWQRSDWVDCSELLVEGPEETILVDFYNA